MQGDWETQRENQSSISCLPLSLSPGLRVSHSPRVIVIFPRITRIIVNIGIFGKFFLNRQGWAADNPSTYSWIAPGSQWIIPFYGVYDEAMDRRIPGSDRDHGNGRRVPAEMLHCREGLL